MPFELAIQRRDNSTLSIPLDVGQQLFVLGPNGSGKSGLMTRFMNNIRPGQNAKRILAQRQIWMDEDPNIFSPTDRVRMGSNISNSDLHDQARYLDQYPGARISITLYELIAAANTDAQRIAHAVRSNDFTTAQTLAAEPPPLKVISDLLALSNIPIEIQFSDNHFWAIKDGTKYGISKLSDGERNALLLAGEVLTAPPNTLVLIDEPERHLHRSITAPLLKELFLRKSDCAFIVSTHSINLAEQSVGARILLVRGCIFDNEIPTKFDVDLIEGPEAISEEFRIDILGSRDKIVFVEGVEGSLDKALYSAIFPNVSIIAKETCRAVEQAVVGIHAATELHRISAFGIVDGDGRNQLAKSELARKGVFALDAYSIEAIYYHAEIRKLLTERLCAVSGDDPNTREAAAVARGLVEFAPHLDRMVTRVVQAQARGEVLQRVLTLGDVSIGRKIEFEVDVPSLFDLEKSRATAFIASGNFESLIARYPIRETSVLASVAKELGFASRDAYERAVRKLLLDGGEPLHIIRNLFGGLPEALGISGPVEPATGRST